MASFIGVACNRQVTVRPVLVRATSPASDKTSICFITAGKDIANGRARSLTEMLSFSLNCASSALRVGSDKAAKVRSSRFGE